MNADFLSVIQGSDYKWESRHPGATEVQLAALADFFGRPLPEDYAAFLRAWNGASLWYRDLWYIRLWSTDDIPSWSSGYGFDATASAGAGVIGDDGADEALVFDMRSPTLDHNYAVFAMSYYSPGWKEVIPIASDFRSVLLLRHELLYQAVPPQEE